MNILKPFSHQICSKLQQVAETVDHSWISPITCSFQIFLKSLGLILESVMPSPSLPVEKVYLTGVWKWLGNLGDCYRTV